MRFLVAGFILLVVGPGWLAAQITPDNVFDLLEIGEMSYSIAVNAGKIDWGGVERAEDEADAMADLSVLRQRYAANRDEASALRYARAAREQKRDDEYDDAYRALLPFLESGRAKRSTVLCAIDNRVAAADFVLARHVARYYTRVYPRDAELNYKLFNASLTGSLHNKVGQLFETTARLFFDESYENHLTESNIEGFFQSYWGNLRREIDLAALERAVELDPANYEYCLTAGFVKTVIVFLTKVSTAGLAADLDGDAVIDLFLDESGAQQIRALLDTALALRPERDIQVYLAYAMFFSTFGDIDRAVEYARQAVSTRPDLPEGYDALLYASMFADVLAAGEITRYEDLADILEAKVEMAGEEAYDRFALSILELVGGTEEGGKPSGKNLARMKHHLDRAWQLDSEAFSTLFGMANYHLLAGNYQQAIGLFTEALMHASSTAGLIAHHNLGLARILDGDSEGGAAEMQRALAIDPDNRRTKRALSALGL